MYNVKMKALIRKEQDPENRHGAVWADLHEAEDILLSWGWSFLLLPLEIGPPLPEEPVRLL